MTRADILEYIDNLPIYEKDYDLFIKLVNNTSPKLFTKIIEEMARGNIYITDFESVLPESTLNKINTQIENQAKIATKLQRLIDFRKSIDTDKNLQIAFDNPTYKAFIEKDEIINKMYDYLNPYAYSGSERDLRLSLLEKAINNPETVILSPDDYIVAIQYDDIELTQDDLNFMEENNLTEDDIKKIKSLSLYLLNREAGE